MGWQIRLLVLWQCALLVLITVSRSHLAGEHPRGNGVDTNLEARIRDFGRKHSSDVIGGAFASVVREVILRFEHDAGDGGDIDNGSGEARNRVTGFLEQGQEGSGHEVELRHICTVDAGPIIELSRLVVEKILLEVFGGGIAALLGTGLDTGIVDQDGEALFAG